MVSNNLLEHPKDHILCITFTKRAAEELKKEVESDLVWVGTIHSFLHEMAAPYFRRPEIVELYFKCFGGQIEERCRNESKNSSIEQGNLKYKERYGIEQELSLQEIKKHLNEISYGETSYTALYYGRLSHDDLIYFVYKMLEAYPVIQRKIVKHFQLIFLDEYQDTDAKVLRIFYNAVKASACKMYIMGDKMQQIYSNYDGSFEEEFAMFRKEKMQYNFRSTEKIVAILNNIYNDSDFSQMVPEEHRGWKGIHDPEVLLCSDMKKEIRKKQEVLPDLLVLYLLNKDRFGEIGAGDLFAVFGHMQKYAHGRKNSAQEVLQMSEEDNPDSFLQMMFLLDDILKLYRAGIYGELITKIKFYKNIFNGITLHLGCHEDKCRLRAIFDELLLTYERDITIGEFLLYLMEHLIIQDAYMEALSADEDYAYLQEVQLVQFRNLADYLANPHVSTQHGVKGESHESVLFVAGESSGNVNVRMYDFFRLWSKIDFSLTEFEKFYYQYKTDVEAVACPVDISKISASEFKTYGGELVESAEKIMNTYVDNQIFQQLCVGKYNKFLRSPNATNAKECFKKNLNLVYGTLQAYRLFYVGCSRAKKNLTILVDKEKLKSCEEAFLKKAKQVGFAIANEKTE